MDEIAWKPGLINFFDIMLEDEFKEVVYLAEICHWDSSPPKCAFLLKLAVDQGNVLRCSRTPITCAFKIGKGACVA